MKWQYKLLIRSLFPFLPFQSSLRSIKRRLIPLNKVNARGVLENGLKMVELFKLENFELKDKTALEIGTGWEPLIPLLLRCAGCEKVITVDLHKLLEIISCKRVAEFILGEKDLISSRTGIKPQNIEEFIRSISFENITEFLKTSSVEYLSPCDARSIPLKNNMVDLVVSNNVLEHIPPQILNGILVEFHRVLHNEGKMYHQVDNNDHWSYTDSSISCVNFLKFNEKKWKLLNSNPIDYQNRLRHPEYLEIFKQTGFMIQRDESVTDAQAIESLKKMKIDSKYASVPHDQLAITFSRIIAQKKQV
jgi:ubiquinone/menaquinone biosynthesis C-methylase UbiE